MPADTRAVSPLVHRGPWRTGTAYWPRIGSALLRPGRPVTATHRAQAQAEPGQYRGGVVGRLCSFSNTPGRSHPDGQGSARWLMKPQTDRVAAPPPPVPCRCRMSAPATSSRMIPGHAGSASAHNHGRSGDLCLIVRNRPATVAAPGRLSFRRVPLDGR